MKTIVQLLIALALTAAFAGCSGMATSYNDADSGYGQSQNK